jgi:hypothetical protein
MNHLGQCERCGQGLKRVRVCASGRHFLILCDECEAVWFTLEDERPTYLKQPELPCPACGASLMQPPSRWATIDEIRHIGWEGDLCGKHDGELKRRHAGS